MDKHNMVRCSDPIHDGRENWVIRIREIFDQDLEDENSMPLCVFNVPRTLVCTNPEAYTPQQIALGPYHHWSPELYDMEGYKLAAAKRTQKQFQGFEFQFLVDKIMILEPKIRACYHKFLDLNGETLAWMMAIDGSFLLDFFKIYVNMGSKGLTATTTACILDHKGRKLTQDTILRDIMMLENQIPIFLLREILELQCPSSHVVEDQLSLLLMKLCKTLSPLKIRDNLSLSRVAESAHLLDFLYHEIVPKFEESQEMKIDTDQAADMEAESETQPRCSSGQTKQLFLELWKVASKLSLGPVRVLRKVLRPIVLVLNMPWKTISALPGASILAQNFGNFFSSQDNVEQASPNHLAEEIKIPSVSQLHNAGVRFCPTSGGITTVRFDKQTATFYLPIVTLDVNTEVIIRNLVAYEAWIAQGPLVLTRYTELMNGIIDTSEDVNLLRKNYIIFNGLKNDEEAARLWNGMSKSIRLTRVPFLDQTIEEVDKYYNSLLKVKARKFLVKYVYESWKILTFLAALLLLCLMALQSFCSVYGCSRLSIHPLQRGM